VSSGTQRVGDRPATFAPVGTYGMELVLKTLLAFGRRLTTCIQQQHSGHRGRVLLQTFNGGPQRRMAAALFDLCSSLVFDH